MLNFRRCGNGPALVLLHGFVGGCGYWIPQESSLKGQFDVIAIDLPGFAGSAHIKAPETLSGYGNLVIETLQELGVKRFSVMGFSMGGMIAQQIAKDFPDHVQSLILYGSSAIGDLPHRFESWEASIDRLNKQGVDATTDKTVATWFVDGTASPYYKMCRDACYGANKDSCITVMRAMQDWSSLGWLKDLTLPTLVIVGDKDKSTKPSDSVVLWEGIPNSEFCVLPGCAHGAHLEKPDLFNMVIGNFLHEALLKRQT